MFDTRQRLLRVVATNAVKYVVVQVVENIRYIAHSCEMLNFEFFKLAASPYTHGHDRAQQPRTFSMALAVSTSLWVS